VSPQLLKRYFLLTAMGGVPHQEHGVQEPDESTPCCPHLSELRHQRNSRPYAQGIR